MINFNYSNLLFLKHLHIFLYNDFIISISPNLISFTLLFSFFISCKVEF